MTGSPQIQHRRLSVPSDDRSALVCPPFDEVGRILESNLRRRADYRYDLSGRCLSEVIPEARAELVSAARCWTSDYRHVDSGPIDWSVPIFLAGHQPQLFHPGVWFKNFALGALAKQHKALAINLSIDSDTIKVVDVLVPGGSLSQPRVKPIALDRAGPIVPFEERRLESLDVFREFGRRAQEHVKAIVPDPLVSRYWASAVERTRHTDNLGACITQSRHQLEGDWGVTSLEVPQSHVCRTRSHSRFTAHLLAQLPRFRDVYNEVIEEYRQVNRVRSKVHPVPKLACDGQWLEAPYWIWTADDPKRRRLFARQRRDEILLSDRHALEIVLPLSPDGDACSAVDRLTELAALGVKIRSRALITTLWARLVLGDLFLHGIGGAKYDRVTDSLISRFFGLEPPDFLVLSATLRLPVVCQGIAANDVRSVDQQLRGLTYHPEGYINGTVKRGECSADDSSELIAAKARWIMTPQTPQNARNRCREIRRINEALQPYVAERRRQLLQQRSRITESLEAQAVLSCREYAFCLFSEKTLREFLDQILPKTG